MVFAMKPSKGFYPREMRVYTQEKYLSRDTVFISHLRSQGQPLGTHQLKPLPRERHC